MVVLFCTVWPVQQFKVTSTLWRIPFQNLGFCIKLAPNAWNHVLHGDTWFKALGAGLSRNKSRYGRFGETVVMKTLAKPWPVQMFKVTGTLWCKPLRNLGFCIKLAPSTWNHVLHGDTWFKALGAGLSRKKSWYGRFGVTVVMKTLAKPWILHQTCAERLESSNTWWYMIQSNLRRFEPE